MEPISFSPQEPIAEHIIIHLIREELKSRKFFEALRELGLDDTFYQVDLIDLIMEAMGLPVNSHECYSYCHGLLRRHSARAPQDAKELLKEAKRVHAVLVRYAGGMGSVGGPQFGPQFGPQSTVHGPRPCSPG